MTELVRGQVSDRPWGLTFAQLGLRELTGQLTLHAPDGRDYRVAFEQGAIIGAASPQPADAATRIAMTSGLITSTQAATVARQISATPEIDEIALLASAARLRPDQVAALRRRVIAQRAARTFSIEIGTFVVDDTITIPVAPDAAADVRTVVLQGARMCLSELRLVTELRELGSHFTLGETALEHASWFGLEAAELPILEALRGGSSVAELEARHRELDPRTVQAVIYALVACRECQVSTPVVVNRPKSASLEPVQVSFTLRSGEHTIPTSLAATTTTATTVARATQPTAPPVVARPASQAEQEFRGAAGTNTTPSPARKAYADDSVALPTRTASSSKPPPDAPPKRPTMPPVAIRGEGTGPYPRVGSAPPREPSAPFVHEETTGEKTGPHARDSGRFLREELTGDSAFVREERTGEKTGPYARVSPRDKPASTPPVVTPRTISSGNVTVSRTTSGNVATSRTISGGIAKPRTVSESSGGMPAPVYSEGSDRVSQSLAEATDAYKRGLEAIAAEDLPVALEQLTRASTLNPHEFDHAAVLAFVQFLSAPVKERPKLADKARKMLGYASQKSREPAQALCFLGQLERLLGNDKQALVHYRAALAASPNHTQAMAEIQAIEDKALAKSGLGLFKKK